MLQHGDARVMSDPRVWAEQQKKSLLGGGGFTVVSRLTQSKLKDSPEISSRDPTGFSGILKFLGQKLEQSIREEKR